MKAFSFIFITAVGIIHPSNCQEGTCEPQFLEQCIKMADPLLKEPKHVFPTNSEDIDHVCKEVFPQTWSEFISCIKSFTATCLSPSQRSDFNRAVGDSINSVHKLCTNEDYKSTYLQNSECIKTKAMEEGVCKKYYEKLVSHIQEGSVSTEDLCCAHDSFKTCVIEETKECPCEGDSRSCRDQTQTASHFAKIIVDNSLGFLLKQCKSIVTPLTSCNGYVPKRPRFEPSVISDNHESTADGYFPSGSPTSTTSIGNTVDQPSDGAKDDTPAGDQEQLVQVAKTDDPRTPKEVSSDDADFVNNDVIVTSSLQSTTQRYSSEVDNRLASAKSRLESWLADSQITDFDEFFRQTFQRGASRAEPSRSKAGPSAHSSSLSFAMAVLSLILYPLIFNFT